MTVSIITPTADQPIGMALLEIYVHRQTVQPDEWIVADDGDRPAHLTLGQKHLHRKRQYEGGQSLAGNILEAAHYAKGDVIVIMEHDDFYAANHIETCLLKLKNAAAAGSVWQRYYNVRENCWIVMRNVGSALCNTALKSSMLPNLRRAAEQAFDQKSFGVDRLFWESVNGSGCVHDDNTVVGIKGLPGRPGLGMGHRPNFNKRNWARDPGHEKLREWIGSDADLYRGLTL